jgi:hypothetical protein
VVVLVGWFFLSFSTRVREVCVCVCVCVYSTVLVVFHDVLIFITKNFLSARLAWCVVVVMFEIFFSYIYKYGTVVLYVSVIKNKWNTLSST